MISSNDPGAPELRLLFVTAPADHADGLVKTLCEERLIACGNVLDGARSHYVWKGEPCHEVESILLMETTSDRLDSAMARILALHPYECPKVVVLDPLRVNDAYLAWAVGNTRP